MDLIATILASVLGSVIGGYILYTFVIPLSRRGRQWLGRKISNSMKRALGIDTLYGEIEKFCKEVEKLRKTVDYTRREQRRLKARTTKLEQAMQNPASSSSENKDDER